MVFRQSNSTRAYPYYLIVDLETKRYNYGQCICGFCPHIVAELSIKAMKEIIGELELNGFAKDDKLSK